MNEFVYVVSLVGKHVFNDWCIQYVITCMSDLDKVRDKIKERYNVEFEKLANQFAYGYWQFDNISDYRDIYLVVERIAVLK